MKGWARSLGARLSAWLALQTMAGLGLVCASIYLTVHWTLLERQDAALLAKEQAMREQLREARDGATQSQIAELLTLLLAGHRDVGVRMTDATGRPIFLQDLAESSNQSLNTHSFELTLPNVPGPITVKLWMDVSGDDTLQARIAWSLLVAALLGATAISFGGFLLVHSSLVPLRQLVVQTRQLTADTLERRLDGSQQPAELQPLIEQINALLNRLEAAYAQMEAFNADVAHELKTPLATLISSSELALRKARKIEDLQEVLGSNLEDLDRLARIVADMLFLSRAHRGAKARRAHVGSLAALANDVVEFHEAAIQEAGLQLRILGDTACSVDTRLLQRAISNLLSNATRHASQGSTIVLRLRQAAPTRLEIVVENQGTTVAPEHLPRLFDRFFRADPARSHADRNHGLGLAIVAAIARMHGGGTIATSADGTTHIGLWLADPRPADAGHAAETPSS